MLATWGDARYAASSPDPHAELVLLPRELPEAARAAIVGNVCALACGESHTLLLDDLGNVYAFGRNRERQCGARFGEHLVNDPAPVSSLRGVFATAIGAGWSTSYAISGSGEVYAWGGLWRSLSAKPRRVDMGNGVFAHSSRTRSMIEYSYSQYLGAASQRGVGGRASEDGDSGANSLGSSPPDSDAGGPAGGRPEPPPPPEVPEEGNGASNSSHGSNSSSSTHSPESLELHGQALRVAPFGMAGGPVAVAVSGGYNFCAVVCSGGQLWTFGLNDRFQCGHGDRHAVDRPRLVQALADARVCVRAVACGQQHSLALCSEGRVYSWGLGVFGALGSGELRDRPVPERVRLPPPTAPHPHAAGAAARPASMAAAEASANLSGPGPDGAAEGGAAYPAEGVSASDSQRAAVGGEEAEGAATLLCCAVSCGANHSVALTEAGDVFAWGHAEYAQTAAGDDGARGESRRVFVLPTKVPPPTPAATPAHPAAAPAGGCGARVVGIACGHLQTALILADGGVATFGWGTAGVLGHGNCRYVLRPARVEALSGGQATAVGMGARHAAVLLSPPHGSPYRRAPAQRVRRQLLGSGLLCDCAFEVRAPEPQQGASASAFVSASAAPPASPHSAAAAAAAAAAAVRGGEGAPGTSVLGVRRSSGGSPVIFRAHVAVLESAWPFLSAALALSQRFCRRRADEPLLLEGVTPAAFEKALEFAYTGSIARLALPLLRPLRELAARLKLPGLRAYAERWRMRHLQGRGDAIDVACVDGKEEQAAGASAGQMAVCAAASLSRGPGTQGAAAALGCGVGTVGKQAAGDPWLAGCAALLDRGAHTDVELLLQAEDAAAGTAAVVLHAHRALLAAGSEYFALLLAGRFADGQSGRIDLSHYNLEPGPAACALRYAYCPDGSAGGLRAGRLPGGAEADAGFAAEVLRASSAFCLDGLKQLAEATLVRHAAAAVEAAVAEVVADATAGGASGGLAAGGCAEGSGGASVLDQLTEWLDSLGRLADQHDAPRLSGACEALAQRLHC